MHTTFVLVVLVDTFQKQFFGNTFKDSVFASEKTRRPTELNGNQR